MTAAIAVEPEVSRSRARKDYVKPWIEKQEKMTFPTDILEGMGFKIVCKQCSSCHGCR